MMDTEDILADALRNPRKYGVKGCALCKTELLSVTAIFEPLAAFAQRIGQPTGKKRLIVYGLCSECATLPDVADKVEVEILKQMGVH